MRVIDARLQAVTEGMVQPKDDAERLMLAVLVQRKLRDVPIREFGAVSRTTTAITIARVERRSLIIG